jgi:hypothetical protein
VLGLHQPSCPPLASDRTDQHAALLRGDSIMTTTGIAAPPKAFDADNHYYEATDAFTRFIDPKMAKRAMQWAEINGRQRLLVGGKINRFIPNPTFDPVAKPGSLDEYFRGRNPQSWRSLSTTTPRL